MKFCRTHNNSHCAPVTVLRALFSFRCRNGLQNANTHTRLRLVPVQYVVLTQSAAAEDNVIIFRVIARVPESEARHIDVSTGGRVVRDRRYHQ